MFACPSFESLIPKKGHQLTRTSVSFDSSQQSINVFYSDLVFHQVMFACPSFESLIPKKKDTN